MAASTWWRTEDWIAVFLGCIVIFAAVLFHQWDAGALRRVVPEFRCTTDSQLNSFKSNWLDGLEEIRKEAERGGQATTLDLSKRLSDALENGDRKTIEAASTNMSALGGQTMAGARAAEIRRHAAARVERIFSADNLIKLVYLFLGLAAISAIGIGQLAGQTRPFLIAFPVVFALACLGQFLAGNALSVDWGFEYVIFALAIGLVISNTVGAPDWLRPAIRTELYLKVELVVLGAGMIFSEVMQAGALGLIQALLVVTVIWYACFWLCRRLGVDDEFGAMLSTAVSICGVSAAIAACGAIQGDKKKLSYVTSLVLIVAVPMMVALPWLAKSAEMNDLVAGAWIGGTLDTSPSVVAAGALISEVAMKIGVIVKFSQNALIGFAAFALALWWSLKSPAAHGDRPSVAVIWQRFPKFVIGFIVASALFSFFLVRRSSRELAPFSER